MAAPVIAISADYSAVIVQHLETLLERAKRGELVCLTCVIDDGSSVQGVERRSNAPG